MLKNVAQNENDCPGRLWFDAGPGKPGSPGFPALQNNRVIQEAKMRSELVYSAGIRIPNRFLLTTLTIKAVQSLHITSTRTEDTANRVFADVASGRFTDVKMPAIEIQPAMDPLLIAPAA